MITELVNIKNLGVFKNYDSSSCNLKKFTDKNVIYGWNYTGKTTLSRLFSLLDGKKVSEENSEIDFKMYYDSDKIISKQNIDSFPYKLLTFNSDFITKNLKWDDSASPFESIAFDVGENIELRNKIKEKEVIKEWIKNKKIEKLDNSIKEFQSLESIYTTESRNIKNDIFNSLIEFTKRDLKKLIQEIKNDYEANLIEDEKSLQKNRSLSLAQNNKAKIKDVEFSPESRELHMQIEQCLLKTPSEAEIIDVLESKSELYQWAKEGLDLHEGKLENCSFCGNRIMNTQIAKLKSYFSNESAKLREEIERIRDRLADEEELCNKILLPSSKNDFIDNLKDDFQLAKASYSSAKNEYVKYLDLLITQLDKKEDGNIFKRVVIDTYNDFYETNLNTAIKTINDIIKKHNTFVSNFNTNQEEARDKIKKHYTAKIIKDYNVVNLENIKNKSEQYKINYNKILDKIDYQISKFEAQLKSIAAAKDEINKYIKIFFNRDDIYIELTQNDMFLLKRGENYANNLSEGEKTAISFSYFLILLESIVRDKENQNTIVFIDDPISSLDSNHIAQIYSTINSFFFRKGINPDDENEIVPIFRQLFISTHNFDFFNFLKDSKNLNKKKKSVTTSGCSYFYTQRVNAKESELINLPKSLHKRSEYIHLFEVLNRCHVEKESISDEQLILLPNAIRRFFELYTLIKLPDAPGEVDYRLELLMGGIHQLKVLHHFSHAASLDKLTKHDELMSIIPQALDELFTLIKKDPLHYDSLLRAIHN